jgi:hypothetical protein
LRKLHQGSTPIDENKSRPGDHGSESLDQILERPPRVDESQYEYARDFFINQVSLIALEMAMIRVRNSFPQIEPQLLALSPSDAGEAAAYRSSALEAWKRGTSAYVETGRHQFSGDGAGGA